MAPELSNLKLCGTQGQKSSSGRRWGMMALVPNADMMNMRALLSLNEQTVGWAGVCLSVCLSVCVWVCTVPCPCNKIARG